MDVKSEAQIICPKCGNPTDKGDEFCGHCGAKLLPAEEKPLKEHQSSHHLVIFLGYSLGVLLLAYLVICIATNGFVIFEEVTISIFLALFILLFTATLLIGIYLRTRKNLKAKKRGGRLLLFLLFFSVLVIVIFALFA